VHDMWHVWGGNGTNRDTHRDLSGKREGKRPLGRPRRRWKYNNDVAKQTRWDGLYWVPLAQKRTKRWALQRPMKCVEISFSRRTLIHDMIHLFPAPNLEGTYTYSRPGKYELRFESVQLLHTLPRG